MVVLSSCCSHSFPSLFRSKYIIFTKPISRKRDKIGMEYNAGSVLMIPELHMPCEHSV